MHLSAGPHDGQKMALVLELVLHTIVSQLIRAKPGPLQEQDVFLTAEFSLQIQYFFFT